MTRRGGLVALGVLTALAIVRYWSITLHQVLVALGIWTLLSVICVGALAAVRLLSRDDYLDRSYQRFQREYDRQQRGLPARPRSLP